MSKPRLEREDSGADSQASEPLLEHRGTRIDDEDDDETDERGDRLATRPMIALLAGLGLIGLAVGVSQFASSSLVVELVVVPAIGLVALAIGVGWIDEQFGDVVDATTMPAVERPS